MPCGMPIFMESISFQTLPPVRFCISLFTPRWTCLYLERSRKEIKYSQAGSFAGWWLGHLSFVTSPINHQLIWEKKSQNSGKNLKTALHRERSKKRKKKKTTRMQGRQGPGGLNIQMGRMPDGPDAPYALPCLRLRHKQKSVCSSIRRANGIENEKEKQMIDRCPGLFTYPDVN